MEIEDYKAMDRLVLDELNVKVMSRYVCTTERGDLTLEFDGKNYAFLLDGEDVTTPKLYDSIAKIIKAVSV